MIERETMISIPLAVDAMVRLRPDLFYMCITDLVNACVARTRVQSGLIHLQIMHTTCGLKIQEHESGLLEDYAATLEEHFPTGRGYMHDRVERLAEVERRTGKPEPPNGKSHQEAFGADTVLWLGIESGQLDLGQWQDILMFDYDPEGREVRELRLRILATEMIVPGVYILSDKYLHKGENVL